LILKIIQLKKQNVKKSELDEIYNQFEKLKRGGD